MLGNAGTLHSNASSLATNSHDENAHSPEVLQQKAGTSDSTQGTLRYLAKELNSKASELANAVSTTDGGKARDLATEVGNDETSSGIRAKLKDLATTGPGTDLTTKATKVTTQYSTVSTKFGLVKQQNTQNAYSKHQPQYQAVEKAWKAFNDVYNADLKDLATAFAGAVGAGTNAGLRGALSNLKQLITNAKTVIEKFNAVADKYKAVTALGDTYKAIPATSTDYGGAESEFDELQIEYSDAGTDDNTGLGAKAGKLSTEAQLLHDALGSAGDEAAKTAKDLVTKLKDAASKDDPKGLKQLLVELNKATGIEVVEKANEVINKYNEVVEKYNAVKDNEEAKKKGSELGNVKSAFKALQTEYNKGQWNNISLRSTVERPHATGLTMYAKELESKATTLKTTAGDQSTSELGSTQNTDLDTGNKPETGLKDKANLLAQKAEALSEASGLLESAATTSSALSDLSAQATKLKNAAKGSGGLFKAAQALATKAEKNPDQEANSQANGVIGAFEKVEENYNKLMGAYKEILDKLTQTDKDKVIAVVKAYYSVKNTYYQMLITYRIRYLIGEGGDGMILHKAKDLYSAANTLANAPKLKDQGTDLELKAELRQLATNLANAVGADEQAGLQRALNQLKSAPETNDEQIVEKALEVIKQYNEVKDAYDAVKEKEKEYNNHARSQYGLVTGAFEALEEKFKPLKKSIVNVLRFRVQELSDKAQTLLSAVDELKTYDDLRDQANALRDAASNGKEGLKEKANQLVSAINDGGDSDGTKATEVITQFNIVKNMYQALANLPKYKELLKSAKDQEAKGQASPPGDGPEKKVQNVEDAYQALKKVYDSILNFTKIKHYSTQVETAADPTGVNAEKVITNFNSLVTAYKALTDQDSVQSQFNDLQKEYSNAIYKYKFLFLTIPSIVTNWLNFLTFVILFIVYVTGGDEPGRSGCEGTASAGTPINSVKLAISGSTHTITLSDGGDNSGSVSTSKIMTLANTGDGTLTISIPGGAIKLKELSITSTTLTINTSSVVSVTKKPNPFDRSKDEKINLKSANLSDTSGTKTLTLTKASDDTDGQAEVQITGESVTLDYSNGTGDITIKGTAIDELESKFVADELHDKHKSTNCCIYSKQYTWSNDPNPYVVWWNIFNIIMPLQSI